MTVTKQVSLHGKRAFITKDDQLAARNGFVAGGDDKPAIVYPSPDTVALFEDFTLAAHSDTGLPIGNGAFKHVTGDTGNGSLVVAGTNGIFRLYNTPSATAALAPTSGKGIAGGLQWKGNQGPGAYAGRLRMGARVKVFPDDGATTGRTTNRIHAFVGFTDIATFEFPVWDTGAGLISNAADYVGFMLSPGGDTGWSGVAAASTAGDSGDTAVSLDTTWTANEYDVLEVEIHRGASDTGGTATFYVNGVVKGTIDTPVSPTVALAPCVYAFQQDTGKQALDIDWVNVSAPRDTGL